MRYLTIQRNKAFAACLMKDKVYIEDNIAPELTINGVPCRKIGELKNGQQVTFTIDDNRAKVFIIVDKMSKDYCNDFFEIPEGNFNVFLTGKHSINAAGNAFRFDNNPNQEAIANRKKGNKRGIGVYIAALIGGIIFGAIISSTIIGGVFSDSTEQKNFYDDGMSIVLTDQFHSVDLDSYNICYESNDTVMFALKEEFTLAEGAEDLTIEEYYDLTVANSDKEVSKLVTDGKLNYFDFTSETSENGLCFYRAYIFKTDDAFWLVQFATKVENADKCKDEFNSYADSIEFHRVYD